MSMFEKFKGKAMWAAVQTPNTKFDPRWCVDLIVEGDEITRAKKIGLKVHEKNGDSILKFTRKVQRKDGTENRQPIVVDASTNPTDAMIGNGSVVNVQVRPFTYKNRQTGESMTSADLHAIQILELVEFGEGVSFDIEDGFVDELKSSKVEDDSTGDSLEF